jgi:guanine deaminase
LVLKKKFPRAKSIDHGDALLTPGFVDCHVHGPQLGVTSAFGTDLVDWLNRYTFPIESKFNNLKFAKRSYQTFAKSILSHGTTLAAVYGTSNGAATEILAKVLQKSGLRAYVGSSLMDQNAPESLLVPIHKALSNLEKLMKTLGSKSLVQPSVVVRFAPTSSVGLLKEVGDFIRRYPEILIQTHLSETIGEIAWVKKTVSKGPNLHSSLR